MSTPARLEEKLTTIARERLASRVDSTWTIQENVGYLSDLEPLWQGRLTDILAGAPELRLTDLLNQATSQANHNTTPLATLLT